jgi:DeoR/GlpR family transcriptional regulator of sugar metabolism
LLVLAIDLPICGKVSKNGSVQLPQVIEDTIMSSSHVFDRQEKILQFLSQDKKLSIGTLAAKLKVSDWTVRRDLNELEQRQQVRRIHGGVVLVVRPEELHQREFDAANQSEAKARIGKTAAQLVKQGQFIVLAAGTTTTQVALALRGRHDINIMTNALNIALDLSREAGIQMTCTGGAVNGNYYTLTGPVTERALAAHYYDLAIVGVSGIDLEKGITVNSQLNAAAINLMLQHASKRMIVADHTKFSQVSYAYLTTMKDINIIITDRLPSAAFMKHFERTDTQVIVAPEA